MVEVMSNNGVGIDRSERRRPEIAALCRSGAAHACASECVRLTRLRAKLSESPDSHHRDPPMERMLLYTDADTGTRAHAHTRPHTHTCTQRS